MEMRLDNGAILAYQRLPYKAWYAIAEFVDNAIDAYLRSGNSDLLDAAYRAEGTKLSVEVVLDKTDGVLRVIDNSMGMSEEELDRAMVIGLKPAKSAGLSEFGMGMKTAAVWFADELEIRTKKLGTSAEIKTTFSVQRFVSGDPSLEVQRTPRRPDEHYTIIELRGLRRRLGVGQLRRTKAFLGSIYREYLREGSIDLLFNHEPVDLPTSREDVDRFVSRFDGTPFLVDFGPWEINNKIARGWVGILKPGSGFTGRNYAGFSLIRNKRVMRGWLDSWRPDEIFGDARNDLLNQRLTGEVYLDGPFVPSHIKDAIDWESDEEEELGRRLTEFCKEFNLLEEARRPRAVDATDPEAEKDRAETLARLEAEMTSVPVQNVITLLDVPKPEMAKVAASVLVEAASSSEPQFEFPIGDRVARLFELSMSPNDPYCEFQIQASPDGSGLDIFVNLDHPALQILQGPEARIAHYHHVLLDAVAEWKCQQVSEPFHPASIRLMKDHLFRSIASFEDGS